MLKLEKPTCQAVRLLALLLGVHIVGGVCQASASALIIDDFAYTNSATARASWVNANGPAVNMASGGEWGSDRVMIMTCDFTVRSSRCYWDRNVSLNLASYTEFELEVFTMNPAPISHFTLYFRSGSGWYGASVALTKRGWQTLRFAVSDFTPEGTPSGWTRIDGIRLSPWKSAPENTYLAARELRAVTPAVVLVRDDQGSNPEVVQQTIDRHRSWLGSHNIRCGVVTRAAVEAGLLQGSRLAILPYNETVSETEMAEYEKFVAGGGKLMVYYLLPSRLGPLLGLRVVSWTRGDFAAWRFADPAINNLPDRVLQASWNITVAATDGAHNSRVTAQWEDGQGLNTGKPAWLSSDHGFFCSHILLGDDPDQKSFSLLCLVGSVIPEIWPDAAAGAISRVGHVGPYGSFEEAVAGIRQQGSGTLRALLVEKELGAAGTNRALALDNEASGRFAQAIQAAQAARDQLRQAYILSLKPTHPEFRAIWEHHATGPYPGDWRAGIAALATNNINAVFPNMLWGGLAHYNSTYLPHSAEFTQHGDQIAACVAAAHERGIQVHVWKVNWNLLGAPQSFINGMRAANRTQVSRTGAPTDWLCPSHPDNFVLERDSMMEVVRNYDVDGIHFDYIRYPDSDHCYCSGCRTRFQAQTGRTVVNWPTDVLSAGPLRTAFLDWRRAQISRLVETVYYGTKALKPRVKVSAAVFPDAASAYDYVGQDWRLWVTNGILDFVCPMDYTTELHNFTNLVQQQLAWVSGRMPVYPGIGAFVLETDATLSQVEATRAVHTGGFILFELSPGSASTLLPAMASGATAPDEPDTDSDLLPDSWEQRWFGNLTRSTALSDTDGDGITDQAEYIAGSDPTDPDPGSALRVRPNNGLIEISFTPLDVEAIGYQNAARHYSLQSNASLAGPWSAVSGFADVIASPGLQAQTLTVAPTPGSRLYRLRTWLEQK